LDSDQEYLAPKASVLPLNDPAIISYFTLVKKNFLLTISKIPN
jgi:hypothetical protein